MKNQPVIPSPEIRARSVARLRQLVQDMDVLIAQLDQINAQLEDDINHSPLTNYRLQIVGKKAALVSQF